MPVYSCPHPYFPLTEWTWFVAEPAMLIVAVAAGLLVVVAGALCFKIRSRFGVVVFTSGVLMPLAGFVGYVDMPDAGVTFRSQFSADDLARLQRELQMREAELERYGREHPGLSNSQLVEGFLETHHRQDGFYFSDSSVPPLFFKVSDWRDKVPRVVVSLGCSNNLLFDSTTMDIEQLD